MSDIQVTRLSNGLHVVSHEMAHVQTVSLGVWIGSGARHERESEHGISHLLEHMAFKGTQTRSARQIVEEIEQVGGDLNAATSLETTAYYARVLKGDEQLALNVLADILLNATFTEQELVRERDVILQEIAGSQDSPEDVVYDLAQDASFPGQALGRTILGTPESVTAFSPDDLREFLARQYLPQNMVVSAAGSVKHNALCDVAASLFGHLTQNVAEPTNPPARYQGGLRVSDRQFEQSHIVIGFEGPNIHEDNFFVAQVLSGALGGGMSSRLFQEAREKRGLCYSIYSSSWGLSDTGMFSIYAATGKDETRDLVDVVSVELEKVARDGFAINEIERAKAQLKAGLLMSLESSSARAEQMARHLLLYDRLRSSGELTDKVDEVTLDSVRLYAEALCAGTPTVAMVGAGGETLSLAQGAQSRFL